MNAQQTRQPARIHPAPACQWRRPHHLRRLLRSVLALLLVCGLVATRSEAGTTDANPKPSANDSAKALVAPNVVGHYIAATTGQVAAANPNTHFVLDIAPSGMLVIAQMFGDSPSGYGRMVTKANEFHIRYSNGNKMSGTFKVEDGILSLTSNGKVYRWTKQANDSHVARLSKYGINVGKAKVLQLWNMAMDAAKDATSKPGNPLLMMKVEVRHMNTDASINLIKPGGQVVFYINSYNKETKQADGGSIVTIGQWGKPTVMPSATPVTAHKTSLSKIKTDLTSIVASARKNGFNSKITHVELRSFYRKNRGSNVAWVLRSNVSSDPIYCTSSTGKKVFFTNELMDNVSNQNPKPYAEGHYTWLRTGGQAGWQFYTPSGSVTTKSHKYASDFFLYWVRLLELNVPGMKEPVSVSVPVRPFSDQEFDSRLTVLAGNVITEERKIPINVGTYQPLTAEEKRVYKSRYPKNMLDVNVPPYMVWVKDLQKASDADRAAIKRAVENEYRRLRSTLSKSRRQEQQKNDFFQRNGILPPE